jgi:2-pyrone-4,6-dicarboxylate lactonase
VAPGDAGAAPERGRIAAEPPVQAMRNGDDTMAQLTPPPDPNTKTPRLRCPPGAIDCHIHLFGPRERWPLDPSTVYETADALPETLMAMHEIMGLAGAVLVSGGAYGRNADHTLDVLRRFPTYFRGVIVPPDELPRAEIAAMHARGVRGVRFSTHPRGRHLAPILPKLAADVFEHGWHVQFYSHAGGIVEAADRLLALPNDIVLDHFGTVVASEGIDQPAFQTILRMLDTGRTWVKLSGPMRCSQLDPPYADMVPFARKLIAHAPERLVWGTDWPHPNMNEQVMPNDGDLLDLMLTWAPDEAVRNRILADNPRRLYDFPMP